MPALPFLAGVLCYANTLGNKLVYDDTWTLSNLWALKWSLESVLEGRALTYAAHALDRVVWGTWLPGWHLTNVLLHGLASVGAAWLALVLTRSRSTGLLAGLLFAVHPAHAEAVAVISFRKDVLAMLCVCLAAGSWLRRPRTPLSLLLACLGLVLGLLAKEAAVIGLVPMLLIADVALRRGSSLRLRSAAMAWIPILGLGLLAALAFLGEVQARFRPEFLEELTGRSWSYPEFVSANLAAFPDVLRLSFLPLRLSPDYPLRESLGLLDPPVLLGSFLLVAWSVAGVLALARGRVLGYAMLWLVVLYLPFLNILPLHRFATAERYLYVPSFGACLLVALLVGRVADLSPRMRVLASAAVLGLLCAAGARTWSRNRAWRDDDTLWSTALQDGVVTMRTTYGAGMAAARRGALGEAERLFARSLELGCPGGRPHLDRLLGLAALEHGAHREAELLFRRALEMGGSIGDLPLGLAGALMAQGRVEEAVTVLSRPLEPALEGRRHRELGVAHSMLGRLDEAMQEWRLAITSRPGLPQAELDLGRSLVLLGSLEAPEHLIRYEQANPESAECQYLIGMSLLQSGDPGAAEQRFQKLLRRSPENLDAWNGLGVAMFALGRREEAGRAWRSALERDPSFVPARDNLARMELGQGPVSLNIRLGQETP